MSEKQPKLAAPLLPFNLLGHAYEYLHSLAHEWGVTDTAPPKRQSYWEWSAEFNQSSRELAAKYKAIKEERAAIDKVIKDTFTDQELEQIAKFSDCVKDIPNKDVSAAVCNKHLPKKFQAPELSV